MTDFPYRNQPKASPTPSAPSRNCIPLRSQAPSPDDDGDESDLETDDEGLDLLIHFDSCKMNFQYDEEHEECDGNNEDEEIIQDWERFNWQELSNALGETIEEDDVRICTYHVIILHEYCTIGQEYWGQPLAVKHRSYDIMYSHDVATWTVYLVNVRWRKSPLVWSDSPGFTLTHLLPSLISITPCCDHQTWHPKFQQMILKIWIGCQLQCKRN